MSMSGEDDMSFESVSGTPANSNASNEGAFNLGSIFNGFVKLADDTIPAYFQLQTAKVAAPAAASSALIVVGAAVVLFLLLRKR